MLLFLGQVHSDHIWFGQSCWLNMHYLLFNVPVQINETLQ